MEVRELKKSLSESVLIDIKDINVDDGITIEDITKIDELLSQNSYIDIPENLFDNIMASINFEEEIQLVEDTQPLSRIEKVRILLRNIKHQISLMDTGFWIVSIMLLLMGLLFIYKKNSLLIFIAPCISLFSIYYLYRGVYYEVSEIEATCKYSLYEILVARFIIIISYNIIFMSTLAIIDKLINDSNIYLLLSITWLTPMLISYTVAMYLYYKCDNVLYSLVSQAVVWISYLYVYNIFLYNITSMKKSMFIGISMMGVIIAGLHFVITLKGFKNTHTSLNIS